MRWEGRSLAVEVLFSRAGLATQILVEAGATRFLFDAGDGTLRDLLHSRFAPQTLTGVFITHGHADHIAGLYGMLGYLRCEGHDHPFTVWYPKGCCEVEALLVGFRTCCPDSLPFSLTRVPLQDGDVTQLGNVTVMARSVEHWHSIRGKLLSPAPALGYRISFQQETIAISGDTALCPALKELVHDADLALIEATLTEKQADEDQRSHLHLTEKAAKELAGLAKNAILTHRATGDAFFI